MANVEVARVGRRKKKWRRGERERRRRREKVGESQQTERAHCLFVMYPEASGGNRTTTLPISAPGSSTNFPMSACFVFGCV